NGSGAVDMNGCTEADFAANEIIQPKNGESTTVDILMSADKDGKPTAYAPRCIRLPRGALINWKSDAKDASCSVVVQLGGAKNGGLSLTGIPGADGTYGSSAFAMVAGTYG